MHGHIVCHCMMQDEAKWEEGGACRLPGGTWWSLAALSSLTTEGSFVSGYTLFLSKSLFGIFPWFTSAESSSTKPFMSPTTSKSGIVSIGVSLESEAFWAMVWSTCKRRDGSGLVFRHLRRSLSSRGPSGCLLCFSMNRWDKNRFLFNFSVLGDIYNGDLIILDNTWDYLDAGMVDWERWLPIFGVILESVLFRQNCLRIVVEPVLIVNKAEWWQSRIGTGWTCRH